MFFCIIHLGRTPVQSRNYNYLSFDDFVKYRDRIMVKQYAFNHE